MPKKSPFMFTTGITALIDVRYITLILNSHDLMMPKGQTLWMLLLSASSALSKSLSSSFYPFALFVRGNTGDHFVRRSQEMTVFTD